MFNLRNRRALTLMAAVVLPTVLPLASQAGVGDGTLVPLRMKYKLGEISRYQTNMSMSMAGVGTPKGPQTGGMPIQQLAVRQEFKTSRLLPNGSAEILVTTTNMQGAAGMGSSPLPKPVTIVMDARGAVTETKGMPAANMPAMFGNMLGANSLGTQQIPLPAKPVKPGDVWANSFTMAGMGTGTVKGQFVKVEEINKHKTALLHFIVSIPVKIMMDQSMQPTQSAAAAQMTMSGNVLMNVDNDVDLLAGRLIRSAGNGAIAMTIATKNTSKTTPNASGPPHSSVPRTTTFNTRITLGTTLIE